MSGPLLSQFSRRGSIAQHGGAHNGIHPRPTLATIPPQKGRQYVPKANCASAPPEDLTGGDVDTDTFHDPTEAPLDDFQTDPDDQLYEFPAIAHRSNIIHDFQPIFETLDTVFSPDSIISDPG